MRRPIFGLIISSVVFFTFGLCALLSTPFGSFPDEQSHLEYARHIRVNHQLPGLSFDIKEIAIPEAFQPPLYYSCAALLYSPNASEKGILFRIRFFSLLLGLGVIFLTWKSSLLLFPGSTAAAIVIPVMAAMNPQFIFSHSGISNISMTGFTCSLTAFLAVRMPSKVCCSVPQCLLLGVAFGLALLSRTITVFLFPVCVAAIYLAVSKGGYPRRLAFRNIVAFIVAAGSIAGWWYLRNWIYFGDPFLWNLHQTTMGTIWARGETMSGVDWITSFAFLHATFWVYFGRSEFHAGIWEYAVYLLVVVVPLRGAFEIVVNRAGGDGEFGKELFNRNGFLLFFSFALFAIAEILVLQTRINSPQGRYLFMAMTPISVVLGSGIIRILPAQYRRAGAVLFSGFMLLFCLYLFARYWAPHYLWN